MAQDKVQLKREEVVGNEVVLEDINPKTKTNSITDSTKGLPLDQTLARMWNAINNKLSRVVNSVNGRTGVVVLDAGDVGLDQVDNISFADIKQWVIEIIKQTFNTKRILVKTYLSEIDAIVGNNDSALADTPFFTEYGEEGKSDYLSYIGYIYWDESTSQLAKVTKAIKVVGYTDRSLIYNVDASTASHPERNFSGGGLGVNIYKYEDALKVYNNAATGSGHTPTDLNNSGLYIDKGKISPHVYFFDGVYGDGTPTDTNALLYYDTTGVDTSTLKEVIIKINGETAGLYSSSAGVKYNYQYIRQQFKVNDIVITNFNDEGYYDPAYDNDDNVMKALYKGMCDTFTMRQPAIGQVTSAPSAENPDDSYVIEFYTFKPSLFKGLKYYKTNKLGDVKPYGESIGVELLEGPICRSNGDIIYNISDSNLSGINTFQSTTNSSRKAEGENRVCYTVLPTGQSSDVFEGSSKGNDSNAMYILPNFSLCVIPGYVFGEHAQATTAQPLYNWPISAPQISHGGPHEADNPSSEDTHSQTETLLGINLEKWINPKDPDKNSYNGYAKNISGLRINKDTDNLNGKWFGFGNEDNLVNSQNHSGGLSVNTGKFLSIGNPGEFPGDVKYDSEFYEDGKVNVRVDENTGLQDVGENKLGIKFYEDKTIGAPENGTTWGGGIYYAKDGYRSGVSVRRGLGLRMSLYRQHPMKSVNWHYPSDLTDEECKTNNPTQLAVSIVDPGYGHDDIELLHPENDSDLYGGLRYIQGSIKHNDFSAIGIRVNKSEALWGSELKKGSEGIMITEDNVLGVQRGNGLNIDETGSLTIKVGPDFSFDSFGNLELSSPASNVEVLRFIDSSNSVVAYNPTGNLPSGFLDINLGTGLKLEGGMSMDTYHTNLVTQISTKINPSKSEAMTAIKLFAYYQTFVDETNQKVTPNQTHMASHGTYAAYRDQDLVKKDDSALIEVANNITRVDNNKIKYSEDMDSMFSMYSCKDLYDLVKDFFKSDAIIRDDKENIIMKYDLSISESTVKGYTDDEINTKIESVVGYNMSYKQMVEEYKTYQPESIEDAKSKLITSYNNIPLYNLIKYLGLSTDNTFEEIKNANELKLSSFNNYSLEQINAAINDINKNYATLTDSDKKIVDPQLQKTLSEFTASYNVVKTMLTPTESMSEIDNICLTESLKLICTAFQVEISDEDTSSTMITKLDQSLRITLPILDMTRFINADYPHTDDDFNSLKSNTAGMMSNTSSIWSVHLYEERMASEQPDGVVADLHKVSPNNYNSVVNVYLIAPLSDMTYSELINSYGLMKAYDKQRSIVYEEGTPLLAIDNYSVLLLCVSYDSTYSKIQTYVNDNDADDVLINIISKYLPGETIPDTREDRLTLLQSKMKSIPTYEYCDLLDYVKTLEV